MDLSIRRAVEQTSAPSKPKDGWLQYEYRRVLVRSGTAENVRPLNLYIMSRLYVRLPVARACNVDDCPINEGAGRRSAILITIHNMSITVL